VRMPAQHLCLSVGTRNARASVHHQATAQWPPVRHRPERPSPSICDCPQARATSACIHPPSDTPRRTSVRHRQGRDRHPCLSACTRSMRVHPSAEGRASPTRHRPTPALTCPTSSPPTCQCPATLSAARSWRGLTSDSPSVKRPDPGTSAFFALHTLSASPGERRAAWIAADISLELWLRAPGSSVRTWRSSHPWAPPVASLQTPASPAPTRSRRREPAAPVASAALHGRPPAMRA
jgi:hypothetical protein